MSETPQDRAAPQGVPCQHYHRRRPVPPARFRVIYTRLPDDNPALYCGVHARAFRNYLGDTWRVEAL